MNALKQLKLAKNGYIIMSVLFYDSGRMPDYMAGLFDGGILHGSRNYAYCIWMY